MDWVKTLQPVRPMFPPQNNGLSEMYATFELCGSACALGSGVFHEIASANASRAIMALFLFNLICVFSPFLGIFRFIAPPSALRQNIDLSAEKEADELSRCGASHGRFRSELKTAGSLGLNSKDLDTVRRLEFFIRSSTVVPGFDVLQTRYRTMVRVAQVGIFPEGEVLVCMCMVAEALSALSAKLIR
jgi:hypothetical protein